MTETPVPQLGTRYVGNIHATGITELYTPNSPVVDICFVHGFTGHPERTWRSKKRAIHTDLSTEKWTKRKRLPFGPQRDNDPEASNNASTKPEFVYWPRDLLPDLVPNARVFTFGYDTNIRNTWIRQPSQNGLCDHARSFLSDLEGRRRLDPRRPLMFIAHSLGGILVKEMLRMSKYYEQSQSARYAVYEATKSLFFFGTPHAGADPCDTLRRVIQPIAEAAGFKVNQKIAHALMPGADISQLLADEFFKWTNERNWSIYTFQEEFKHNVLKAKIVEDYSSSIHDPYHEIRVHIRADHVDMCRFTSAEDPEFRKVSDLILKAQENLSEPPLPPHPMASQLPEHEPPDSCTKLSAEQIDEILEQLSFEGIDARYMTLKSAQRKTCQWLLKHHSWESWHDPLQMDTHHGILWMKGKPGTGKSISMKYLYQNAARNKNGRIVLKFFFNARGTPHEHSTEGMYRSLLWQLIVVLRDTGVASDHFIQFLSSEDACSWPIEALKDLFRSVLWQLNDRELYCFIDALDECPEDEIRDMIYFFEELGEESISSSSNVRVCFSSRHYPHITIRHGLQLVLEDEDAHSNDIRCYIHSQLRINHNQLRQKIEDEIFERSSKIFLWAVLVVDILNKENDKGGNISVQKRLRQIPRGLHDLFQDILTRDNENIEEMVLCIQWILFAKRPLRPEELYFGIQCGSDADASLDWDETVVSIEHISRFNLNASKGLAEVTKKDDVIQFIHESVRDYLIREHGLEKLLLRLTPPRSLSEGASQNRLRDICLAQLEVAQSTQQATKNKNSRNKKPFLRYAVEYILNHANSAQNWSSDQSEFLSTFPLEKWVNLDNELQRYRSRRHTVRVNLLYILAEKNLASLIHIHPGPHDSFTLFEKKERFPNPLVAAMAFGNNEAISALVLECAKQSLGPGQLGQIETELRSMPQFEPDLRNTRWERIDTCMLFSILNCIILCDALWDHLQLSTTMKPGNMLASFPRSMSVDMASYMIQRGALVNGIDEYSKDTALTRAVAANSLSAAEFILGKGADPNIAPSDGPESGSRSLDFAKSPSMVELLIHHGGRLTKSPPRQFFVSVEWFLPGLMGLRKNELRSFFKPTYSGFRFLHYIVEYGGSTALPLLRKALELTDDSVKTLIKVAFSAENSQTLMVLLEADPANINAPQTNGCTALCIAFSRGDYTTAQRFLALGARPHLVGACDHTNYKGLVIECVRKSSACQMEVLEALLRHSTIDFNFCDNGVVPLCEAISTRNFKVSKLLLAHPSIDVNLQRGDGKSPLLVAISLQLDTEIIELLLSHPSIDVNLQDIFGNYPLLLAVSLQLDTEIIELLLGNPSIDVNLQDRLGNYPLSEAVLKENLTIIKILLSYNSTHLNKKRPFTESILHLAISTRNFEIIELLLSHPSIDVQLQDSIGDPLLWEAASTNNLEITKLLLFHPKIEVNRRDMLGFTPLLRAAGVCSASVIQLLLTHRQVDRKATWGERVSVLDRAKGNPDPEVFQLLQDME